MIVSIRERCLWELKEASFEAWTGLRHAAELHGTLVKFYTIYSLKKKLYVVVYTYVQSFNIYIIIL